MTQNSTSVYVPVYEVFPEIKSDFQTFKELLSKLSRTDTLFWCARLNKIVTNSEGDHISRQQRGLNQFMTPEEIDAINGFILKSQRDNTDRVMVFFRGQILELMRWVILYCKDQPNDGGTFNDPIIRRKFSQALLIASDLWSRRIFENRFSLEGDIKEAREKALGAIRKSIEGNSFCPELERSFGRGWIIFRDHFSKIYPLFNDEFKSAAEISIDEYFSCLLILAVHYNNPKIDNSGIFDSITFADSLPIKSIFQKYLALESQSIKNLYDALWPQSSRLIANNNSTVSYNYLPLRQRPILLADDGRAIVLDTVFFSEKAMVGPIFMLAKGKINDEANKIFVAFGEAFEEYACDILKRMFSNESESSNKQLTCKWKISVNEGEAEIDACLNKNEKVVIFEMKAVWIREDKILEDDYTEYSKHLLEKYGLSRQESKADKVKGIGQLARVLNLISSDYFHEKSQTFIHSKDIYPVLLVYDDLLTAPAYGNFLNIEFERLLKAEYKIDFDRLNKKGIKIHPLIVINIEDLENLECSIKHFDFYTFLSDYSNACFDRLTSLNNFIASSKYKDLIYKNEYLSAKSLDLFKITKQLISTT